MHNYAPQILPIRVYFPGPESEGEGYLYVNTAHLCELLPMHDQDMGLHPKPSEVRSTSRAVRRRPEPEWFGQVVLSDGRTFILEEELEQVASMLHGGTSAVARVGKGPRTAILEAPVLK